MVFALAAGCGQQKSQQENTGIAPEAPAVEASDAAVALGAPIPEGAVLDAARAAALFGNLSATDTLQTTFEAEVLEVCQAKGCWMKLALPGQDPVMVRFKDYGFFVPKDLAGTRVTVSGKAFVSEVSEADRRHLAQDAGAPEEEVLALVGPVKEAGFEADGVRFRQ
ncbi:DUF4920 domain-containing protein [Robiginitalea sp. M366]|uniref:DUF4920 domain-containing protein n=1 Tax=Robiginitalea aestuariiviva TaxID=3036903 RepID=UPI00240E2237|nr:DUF4920 domain-containing protein [Robiginitalea aestuariiviva]MDG1572303.1 DUF4920 domain-containing protein [Robiginitalea aestuariiviva]